MKRVVVLLALLVTASVTAEGTLTAQRVEATQATMDTAHGVLRLQPPPGSLHLDFTGPVSGRIIDDQMRVVPITDPEGRPVTNVSQHERITTPFEIPAHALMQATAQHTSQSVVLLQGPLTVTSQDGIIHVQDQTHDVLETSHAFRQGNEFHYHYEVRSTLNATLDGPGTYTALTAWAYLWGVSLQHDGQQYRSGYWVDTEPGYEVHHYAFIELDSPGTVTGSGSSFSLYAPSIHFNVDGALDLEDAQGHLRGPDGTYTVNGDVKAQDGSYTLHHASTGILLSPFAPPSKVTGTGITDAPGIPAWATGGIAVASVALVVGVVLMLPLGPTGRFVSSLFCLLSRREERLLAGIIMSQQRGTHVWGLWITNQFLHAIPDSPVGYSYLGQFLIELGYGHRALRYYTKAHHGFQDQGDLAAAAHNAVDAAKAATQIGDEESAVAWLQRAFRLDAPILGAVENEPLFDRLGTNPRFQNMMGLAVPE